MTQVRISQLPAANIVELTDDIEFIFNVDNVTKRTTFGDIKSALLSCGYLCAERTFTPAEILSLWTTPVAMGISIPANYGAMVVGGYVDIVFNSVAYSGGGVNGTDLIVTTLTASTRISTMSALLGTTLDANGVIAIESINPLEKRCYENEDIYVSTGGTTDVVLGDSDVTVVLFYKLIPF